MILAEHARVWRKGLEEKSTVLLPGIERNVNQDGKPIVMGVLKQGYSSRLGQVLFHCLVKGGWGGDRENCPLCGGVRETEIHLFLFCPRLDRVRGEYMGDFKVCWRDDNFNAYDKDSNEFKLASWQVSSLLPETLSILRC